MEQQADEWAVVKLPSTWSASKCTDMHSVQCACMATMPSCHGHHQSSSASVVYTNLVDQGLVLSFDCGPIRFDSRIVAAPLERSLTNTNHVLVGNHFCSSYVHDSLAELCLPVTHDSAVANAMRAVCAH